MFQFSIYSNDQNIDTNKVVQQILYNLVLHVYYLSDDIHKHSSLQIAIKAPMRIKLYYQKSYREFVPQQHKPNSVCKVNLYSLNSLTIIL